MATSEFSWSTVSDVLLYPIHALENAGNEAKTALHTTELVLILLAIAVILFIIYNPGFLGHVGGLL